MRCDISFFELIKHAYDTSIGTIISGATQKPLYETISHDILYKHKPRHTLRSSPLASSEGSFETLPAIFSISPIHECKYIGEVR